MLRWAILGSRWRNSVSWLLRFLLPWKESLSPSRTGMLSPVSWFPTSESQCCCSKTVPHVWFHPARHKGLSRTLSADIAALPQRDCLVNFVNYKISCEHMGNCTELLTFFFSLNAFSVWSVILKQLIFFIAKIRAHDCKN